MAMVASASVRRTREKRAERRGRREEGKGGLKIAGGGWVGTGKKGRLRGEEGWLARKRPPPLPRKWRHKRPHGRKAPSLDAGDGPGDGEKGKIGEKRPARGKGARGGYTAGM